MTHTNKILSFGLMLAFLISAVGTPALAASPADLGQTGGIAGIREFARCFVADVKIIPQAKKLTPQGYQQLEQALDVSFTAAGLLKNNPYWDALLLGAQIGKFMGYNFIWYVGAVQDCWGQLKR